MNLHGIVAPYIGAVNPLVPVTVQLSTGPQVAADYSQQPTFATPGAITAAIAAAILTVSAITAGYLGPGDTVSGASVPAETEIVAQLSGTPGGIGTYQLSRAVSAPIASEAMTTALLMTAQIQPISSRDIQLMEGLVLGGNLRKFYLYGSVDSVTRVSKQGGDLITVANGGVDDGIWLVNQVLEQFPDWVSAAATLQNGS